MSDKKRFCGFSLPESVIYKLALWCTRSGTEKSDQVDQAIRCFLDEKIARLDPVEQKWFADAETIAESRRAKDPPCCEK